MDKYNCCEMSDAKSIKVAFDFSHAVVFPLGIGEGTCLIIEMSKPTVLGVMPFGGNPKGRIWVSVYGYGANHFSPERTHPSYFAEKLKLGDYEAKQFAHFWKDMWSEEK